MILLLLFVLLLYSPFLIIYYFFLRTIRNLLWAVSEQNRKMSPPAVWLNWIPYFCWPWMFVTIVKVRESARAEIAWKGLRANGNMGFGVGIASGVLAVLWSIVGPIFWWGDNVVEEGVVIEALYWCMYGSMLVCMLIYWMRVSELQGLLAGAVPVPGSPAKPTETVSYRPQTWHQAPQPEPPVPAPQAPGPPVPTGPPLGAESAAAAAVAAGAPAPVAQPAPQVQPATGSVAQAPSQSPPATMPVASPSAPIGVGPMVQSSVGQSAPAPAPPGQPPVVPPAICPSCGTTGHHVGGFCRSCGRSVQVVWPTAEVSAVDEPGAEGTTEGAAALSAGSCLFCGAPYKLGGKFCSSCGRPAG